MDMGLYGCETPHYIVAPVIADCIHFLFGLPKPRYFKNEKPAF
jgi:hypothetical protein